jgi:hypothetical protein
MGALGGVARQGGEMGVDVIDGLAESGGSAEPVTRD